MNQKGLYSPEQSHSSLPLIYVTFQGKIVVQGEDTFMWRTWDVLGVGGLEYSILHENQGFIQSTLYTVSLSHWTDERTKFLEC